MEGTTYQARTPCRVPPALPSPLYPCMHDQHVHTHARIWTLAAVPIVSAHDTSDPFLSCLQAFAVKLGLTCSAASAAEAATYPIDAIKTRLQLQVGGGDDVHRGRIRATCVGSAGWQRVWAACLGKLCGQRVWAVCVGSVG
eukprot:364586-Chlamydomonas_euryale.AAC.16